MVSLRTILSTTGWFKLCCACIGEQSMLTVRQSAGITGSSEEIFLGQARMCLPPVASGLWPRRTVLVLTSRRALDACVDSLAQLACCAVVPIQFDGLRGFVARLRQVICGQIKPGEHHIG